MKRMRRLAERLVSACRTSDGRQDLLFVAGFAGLVCGVAFVHWPSALMVGGLLLIGVAVLTGPSEE